MNNSFLDFFQDYSIKKLNYHLCLLLSFSLPFYRRVIPYIIVLWVLTWLLEGDFKAKFSNIKNKVIFYLLCIFYLIHVIGLIYSENINSALFDLEVKLSLFVFPIILVGANELYKKKFHEILMSFVIGNVIASLVCLINSAFNAVLYEDFSFFFYGKFSIFHHTSYFSMYLAFSIAILFYFLHKGIFRHEKWIETTSIVLIIYFLVIVYLLSSKAGIICGFSVVIISILFQIIKKKQIYPIIFLFILSCISFYFALKSNDRMQSFNNFIKNESNDQFVIQKNSMESSSVRVLIWEVTFDILKDNFWLGVGIGDIKDNLISEYNKNNLNGAKARKLNVHNQFLETFLGSGIIGLVILLLIFIIPLINSFKINDLLFITFIIILFINFLVESMLNTQAGVLFIAFFYSLLAFIQDNLTISPK